MVGWGRVSAFCENNTSSCLILQVCLAYKSCTAEELDIRWLKSRCRSKDQYVFEEFCGIVTEYRQQVGTERSQSEAVYYGEANHFKI